MRIKFAGRQFEYEPKTTILSMCVWAGCPTYIGTKNESGKGKAINCTICPFMQENLPDVYKDDVTREQADEYIKSLEVK